MPLFGGMITIIIKGGLEKASQFLERTNIFSLAESLGGVESLIEHPAIMDSCFNAKKNLEKKIGVVDGLVRISVGIESLDDLLDDLNQALA